MYICNIIYKIIFKYPKITKSFVSEFVNSRKKKSKNQNFGIQITKIRSKIERIGGNRIFDFEFYTKNQLKASKEFRWMSNSGKKKAADDDEVEQLLRAAQDDMLLKLNLNSHMARGSSAAAIDPDLDRRFLALKKTPKPTKSRRFYEIGTSESSLRGQ
ncbi:hypothetical protein ACP275_05G058600 [Erythranthe tilingii]